MSLSSTSNSLKSSGTFNSNSSINSTPSVDRYAALKDLDEQLREIKEKDNNNTLSSTTSSSSSSSTASSSSSSATANPFNMTSVQANPFQATSSPPWFSEQQQHHQQQHTPQHHQSNGNGGGGLTTTTMTNGLSGAQHIYAMTNGTTNGLYDQQQQQQSAFALNGSIFNGNGMHSYPKVTDTNLFNGSFNMTNGFPPKNPFAVSEFACTKNEPFFSKTFSRRETSTTKCLDNLMTKSNLESMFFLDSRYFNSRHQYWMQPPIHFCESRQAKAVKYNRRDSDRRRRRVWVTASDDNYNQCHEPNIMLQSIRSTFNRFANIAAFLHALNV